MIGPRIIEAAVKQSNGVSTDDPVITLSDAGVDVSALNEYLIKVLTAFANREMTVGEATTAAFVSGFELGVRSAKIERDGLDALDAMVAPPTGV